MWVTGVTRGKWVCLSSGGNDGDPSRGECRGDEKADSRDPGGCSFCWTRSGVRGSAMIFCLGAAAAIVRECQRGSLSAVGSIMTVLRGGGGQRGGSIVKTAIYRLEKLYFFSPPMLAASAVYVEGTQTFTRYVRSTIHIPHVCQSADRHPRKFHVSAVVVLILEIVSGIQD